MTAEAPDTSEKGTPQEMKGDGRPGLVVLVGAGPGDPGLITHAGLMELRRAGVVVYDRLVAPELLDFAPRTAERIYVGKTPGGTASSQQEIIDILIRLARSGRRVVRLKGGDPYVFGRGGEEALALAEAGIPFRVIPGVTAACAAAAFAGIPLTHRDLAAAVTLATGRGAAGKPGAEHARQFARAASAGGTLVVYMGVGRLEKLVRELLAAGRRGDEPAAVVMWAGTPRQRTVQAPLQTIPEAVRSAGLTPPALLITGDVVSLAGRLAWYETLPLFGRRIVVTRPADRAGPMLAALRELGGEVTAVPVIRTEPRRLDPGERSLLLHAGERFDAVLFTSAAGVDRTFDILAEERADARRFAGALVGAIGPATADALRKHGIRPDIVPDEYRGAALARAAAAALKPAAGRTILLARAADGGADLPDILRREGADVRDLAVYRTVVCPESAAALARALTPPPDVVTFTSPSCVRAFFELYERTGLPGKPTDVLAGRAASIGPVTSTALARFGVTPAVEAEPHTGSGLVEAIVRMLPGTAPRRPVAGAERPPDADATERNRA